MMITVKVGELRNHFSAYLRKIRQGAEIVISDRDKPVGRLLPFERQSREKEWALIDPSGGYEDLRSLSFPPCPIPMDVVEELVAERRSR